ncbi:iron-sulfur cluster assembly protein SufB [Klebsiella pneumoniae]|uniref:Iron-sulfur cluster assembly protein SufB n=1 Tax=Klebsiella pneumoniae TaxID=573 RepID=A0A377XAL6_KLEPN|nr:iron-sulfur cluster assembly protein SufB [Klebsiella pneumoniae]
MSRNTEATDDVKTWTGGPLNYKEGFFTRLQTDELAKGINEEVVRAISARRNEPQWMLEFRLNAYRAWLEMEEPHWLKAHYDKLNYQDYSYYSAPSCGNCDETCASEPGAVQQTGANTFLTSEVEEAFNQLGVPVREGREVAVDAIFDSVSVATTYREKLAEQGIIFCSFGEAIHDHPELVKKYLGTVVPGNDNFFAALNAAVASDGTLSMCRRASAARWSCRPISASTPKRPGSLNAPFWWPMKAATSAILKAARRRCATAISCMPRSLKSSSIKTRK